MYTEEFIENLIQEAKRRYPLGTEYVSLMGMSDSIKLSTTIKQGHDENNVVAYTFDGSTRILVSFDEPTKWANITKLVEEQIINTYILY